MTGMNRSKKLYILISLVLLGVISLAPTPEGLTGEGQRVIAVFVMAVLLWSTAALPLSVTGLLVIAALPLLRITTASTAYSSFGNTAVFFILGAFVLAAAMMKTGLSKRFSFLILRRFDSSPRRLIGGVLLTSASLAFIMPEHAVAAIMFPVVLGIAEGLELEPMKSKFGMLLFISLAWGSIIGGIATLLGGARNPLAVGLLQDHYGLEISFFEWMTAAAPLTFIVLIVAYVVLMTFFQIDVKDVSKAKRIIEKEITLKGQLSESEKKLSLVFIGTLFSWIFLSAELGIANIALLSCVSLFVLDILEWKDVENYVNWGVILMYGGAISLGSAFVSTGAGDWFIRSLMHSEKLTPLYFVVIVTFVALFLTEGVSNVAAVAMLLPIAFSAGTNFGINPIAIVYLVALPSGLAFVFPVATPPNAIAYSSGYYEISDVIKPGIVLNILSWIIFFIFINVYWPIVGLNIT